MRFDNVLRPMLIVSDAHRPFHDQRAWDLMMEVGRDLKPQNIVSIGDFADFYSVSSHSKDPSRVNQLDKELEDVKGGLDELEALDAEDYDYIEGNHEDRLKRYLQDKAPELFGVMDTASLLDLNNRGWRFTPYKDFIEIGKVHYTHDVGVAGRNAVYKALEKFMHSVVTGHTHRLQYVVEGTATGESKLSAMFGWLGDASKVDYMHRVNVNTNWALGFGVGYMHPDTGVNYLVPVPIVKAGSQYSVMVNGRLYTS